MTKVVILNRVHYRYLCEDFLHEESFGMIDADDVLDVLCRGIKGCIHDLTYIRDMVFSDILFQGHMLFDNKEKMDLLEFFGSMRARILEELSLGEKLPRNALKVRYVEHKSNSRMLFEVLVTKRK